MILKNKLGKDKNNDKPPDTNVDKSKNNQSKKKAQKSRLEKGSKFPGADKDKNKKKVITFSKEDLNEYKNQLTAEVLNNTTPTGIVTDDCFILTCNPAFASNFGFFREELIGANVNLLVDPKIKPIHDNYVASFFRNENNFILNRILYANCKNDKKRKFEFQICLNNVQQKTFQLRYATVYANQLEDKIEFDDPFIINYHGLFSKIYENLFLMCLMAIIFLIPYQLVFPLDKNLKYTIFGILCSYIYISFNRTIVNSEGDLIFDRCSIMTKYLSSWFLFDVVMAALWILDVPNYQIYIKSLKLLLVVKMIKVCIEYKEYWDYIMFYGDRRVVSKTKDLLISYETMIFFIILILVEIYTVHLLSIGFLYMETNFVSHFDRSWYTHSSWAIHKSINNLGPIDYLDVVYSVLYNICLLKYIEWENRYEQYYMFLIYYIGYWMICFNLGILYYYSDLDSFQQNDIDQVEEILKNLYLEEVDAPTLAHVEHELNEGYRKTKVKSIAPLEEMMESHVYEKLQSDYYAKIRSNFKLFSLIGMNDMELISRFIISRNRPKVFNQSNQFEEVYMVIRGKIICSDMTGLVADDFIENEIVYPHLLLEHIGHKNMEGAEDVNNDNKSIISKSSRSSHGNDMNWRDRTASKADTHHSGKTRLTKRTGATGITGTSRREMYKALKYEYSGVATENSEYFVMHKDIFKQMIIENPDIRQILLSFINKSNGNISTKDKNYTSIIMHEFNENKKAGLIVYKDFEIYMANSNFEFNLAPLETLSKEESGKCYLQQFLFKPDGTTITKIDDMTNGIYLFKHASREIRFKLVKESKEIVHNINRISNYKKKIDQIKSNMFFIYLSSENNQAVKITRAELALNILEINLSTPTNDVGTQTDVSSFDPRLYSGPMPGTFRNNVGTENQEEKQEIDDKVDEDINDNMLNQNELVVEPITSNKLETKSKVSKLAKKSRMMKDSVIEKSPDKLGHKSSKMLDLHNLKDYDLGKITVGEKLK